MKLYKSSTSFRYLNISSLLTFPHLRCYVTESSCSGMQNIFSSFQVRLIGIHVAFGHWNRVNICTFRKQDNLETGRVLIIYRLLLRILSRRLGSVINTGKMLNHTSNSLFIRFPTSVDEQRSSHLQNPSWKTPKMFILNLGKYRKNYYSERERKRDSLMNNL